MSSLILTSPLQGWSAPLEEVPDPVFAGRMLGDGVAIDPTGDTLHAPCDGELILVPASRHAVTIRAANGAEVLMHIGIDTVTLAGEGFVLHARQGDRVRAGDRLVSFDLERIAKGAKSLITPMIVTDGAQFSIARRLQNDAVKVGDFLMELQSVAPATRSGASGVAEAVRHFVVHLEHGIHARPAALIASCAKRFDAEIVALAHGRRANAKSAVSLMTLGVRFGDEMIVEASGAHAEQAVAALEAMILGAAGSPPGDSQAANSQPANSQPDKGSRIERSITGVIASRGLAIGRAVQLSRPEIQVPEAGRGVPHERAGLEQARALLTGILQQRASASPGAQSEIAQAHLEFIDDPELLATAQALIEQGKSAAYAWRQAIQRYVTLLKGTGDARLTERIDDLLDLENQLLLTLLKGSVAQAPAMPDDAIVLANELLPSQLAQLDSAKLAGICTAAGGPTSHVAILAAAMGIPALVAAGPAVLRIPDNTRLVLDAESGLLLVDPDAEQVQTTERVVIARRARRAAEQAAAQRECHTADGSRIEIFANAGSLADAHASIAHGAEGCGLLRTEFLFLDRQSPPDEAEQAAQYQAIASVFAPRPLVIRTLDIGGDKPIPYLPLPREDNPALGLRGVRTSLWRPDLLRAQLRAVLRVQPHEQCRLLLPMITSAAEVRAVRAVLDEERRSMGVHAAIPVGVMIETPASAVIADQLAREADFLSIGTNDLTQYTLAMDRGHPELAAQLDALHPAVLRLIAETAKAARAHNRPVAVCGGLASDPIAAPVLIGLGVDELSTVPSIIPQLKALIADLTMEECRDVARSALEQESAEAVRTLLLSRARAITNATA